MPKGGYLLDIATPLSVSPLHAVINSAIQTGIMTEPHGTIDFFISYRGQQTAWAIWINWVVRAAGYSTVLMEEFKVGTDWYNNMSQAVQDCRRLIPLFSNEYWTSGACVEEFDAYGRRHVQNNNARFILPLFIQECTTPKMHDGKLAARLYALDRDAAHAEILKALVGITPVVPTATPYMEPEPHFPGVSTTNGASTTAASASVTPFPASAAQVDRNGFLDCIAAFETFGRMLTVASSTRILLVHGHGNQGKSTLLSTFFNHTRSLTGPKSTARVEFKKAGSTPEEHVASIALALGVAVPSSGSIDQRVHALLDACSGRPAVIFFDAYEHAEHQHRHWVGRFLERCLDDEHLRCVVAGRELPPAKSQPWVNFSVTSECDALKDKDAFADHAIAMGYKGSREEIAVFVSSLVLIRDRSLKNGHDDHGISSETALDEIKSLCSRGGTLT